MNEFRVIVESSLNGIVIFQDGKVVFANPAAKEITGYELDKLNSKKLREIVHPEDRERVWRLISGEDIPREIEFRIKRKDGRTVWLQCLIRTIEFRGKSAVLATFVDITRRKESERRLRLYRKIFERSLDGIAIVDKSGRYVEQNKAHAELIGYKIDELRDKTPAIHLGEQFSIIFKELKEKEVFRGEVVSRRKDGSEVYVELSAFPIKDEKGEVICYVGIKRDITQQKKLMEELKRSEEKFRLIVENINDVIAVVDSSGRIAYMSPSSEKILGYKPEERIGGSIFDNIHPDDVERIRNEFAKATREAKPVRTLARYRRKDGKYIWVEVSGSPVRKNGALAQGILALRDVTERVRIQSFLQTLVRVGKVLVQENDVARLLKRVCDELVALPGCVGVALHWDDKHFTAGKIPTESNVKRYTFPVNKGSLLLFLDEELSEREVDMLQTLAKDIAFAIRALELNEARRRAYKQMEKNIEQFAALVDGIRNPLAIISGLVQLEVKDEELAKKLMEQIERIDELVSELERGWIESEKVREFLKTIF